MITWTLRRNGQRMVTIRTEHHLPVQDMAYVLGCYAVDNSRSDRQTGDLVLLAPISRAEGERAFRTHIAEHGPADLWAAWERREDDMRYWGDPGREQIRAWVVTHLLKHYGPDVANACDWAIPQA